MTQLYLYSATGSVHEAKTFGNLRLTLEKAVMQCRFRSDSKACDTLALNCGIFSKRPWKTLQRNVMWPSQTQNNVVFQTCNVKNIRKCMCVLFLAGGVLLRTHTHTCTHCVLCMGWLTCRDIWLVLHTLFGAAQWVNTTHNGRKKKKGKATE